jgi:hypothetical protein
MGFNYTEPMIISDVFATCALPEDLGDAIRFTSFIQQESFSEAGIEYRVVNRVIMPKPAILRSIQATMKVLGVACCGGERLALRH